MCIINFRTLHLGIHTGYSDLVATRFLSGHYSKDDQVGKENLIHPSVYDTDPMQFFISDYNPADQRAFYENGYKTHRRAHNLNPRESLLALADGIAWGVAEYVGTKVAMAEANERKVITKDIGGAKLVIFVGGKGSQISYGKNIDCDVFVAIGDTITIGGKVNATKHAFIMAEKFVCRNLDAGDSVILAHELTTESGRAKYGVDSYTEANLKYTNERYAEFVRDQVADAWNTAVVPALTKSGAVAVKKADILTAIHFPVFGAPTKPSKKVVVETESDMIQSVTDAVAKALAANPALRGKISERDLASAVSALTAASSKEVKPAPQPEVAPAPQPQVRVAELSKEEFTQVLETLSNSGKKRLLKKAVGFDWDAEEKNGYRPSAEKLNAQLTSVYEGVASVENLRVKFATIARNELKTALALEAEKQQKSVEENTLAGILQVLHATKGAQVSETKTAEEQPAPEKEAEATK